MIANRNRKNCWVSRCRGSWNQNSKSSTCSIYSSSSKWSKWNIQLRVSNNILICVWWNCSLRERIHKAKRRYFVIVRNCFWNSTSDNRCCYRNLVNSYICWTWRCAIKSWRITCCNIFVEVSWYTSTINFVSETPRTTIFSVWDTPNFIWFYIRAFYIVQNIRLRWRYNLFNNAMSYDNIERGPSRVSGSEWHGLSDFINSCIHNITGENL